MFPFTIKYSEHVIYQIENKNQILSRLNEYVLENKGQYVEKYGDKILFHTSMFGWNWDKFAEIEKGIFTLTDSAIHFEFFMYRHFIIVAISTIAVFCATQLISITFFVFLLFGMFNWIIALIKYKRMLKKFAASINVTYKILKVE